MDKKIFCIGLNKTGTSSLHKAFEILGFKSVHCLDDEGNNIKDIIQENFLAGDNILKGLEQYDAISDWDMAPHTSEIFKEFDKQYPDSKFILNVRDLESWLDSREKHVKRNQERKRKKPKENIKWLTIDRDAWEIHFKAHYDEVYNYFKGRKNDLLVFDVTKDDGWDKLCPFLNLPIPNVPFPKKNVASRKKSFFHRVLLKLKKSK